MNDDKIINIGTKSIEMEYSIRKKVDFDSQIVILIYDKAIIANNVISYDKQGNELWRINDILNIKRPTGNVDIQKEDESTLIVCSSLGMIFRIDIEKKQLIEKQFLR